MTTFITGDRSDSIIYPGLVAIAVIRALAAGDHIVTGDNTGVESHVRAIMETAGVTYGVVTTPEDRDWDARHAQVRDDGYAVVAIHSDPQSSSVIRSLLATIPDDALTLSTPVDLLV